MNYRHLFHAGNFADVFKHIVLGRLLKALQRKDKGFVYFETHAGAGRYDLRSPEALKSGEYRDGIGRLWEAGTADEGWEDYLAVVRASNPNRELRFYPGSPAIAHSCLRTQDRMRLAEQSPEACDELRAIFGRDPKVNVQCKDGYAALKEWLPPHERRGLVFIDPPYEDPNEWEFLASAIALAAERWAQGVYAIWYPLKPGITVNRLKPSVTAAGFPKALTAELYIWPADTPFRLNGCGMLILNPPWQIDVELGEVLPVLARRLQQGPASRGGVEWMVSEES